MAEPSYRSVFRDGLFAGKAAIVTGGGTGIGKAIATELLLLGCNVAIASRNEEVLKEALEELQQHASTGGGRVIYVKMSIKVEEDVQRLVTQVLKEFGQLDFVVNNGGGQFPQAAADMKLKVRDFFLL